MQDATLCSGQRNENTPTKVLKKNGLGGHIKGLAIQSALPQLSALGGFGVYAVPPGAAPTSRGRHGSGSALGPVEYRGVTVAAAATAQRRATRRKEFPQLS